jgi:hypothetical protein
MASSRLYFLPKSMPAAAGHSPVEARKIAIATTNDQPRGY